MIKLSALWAESDIYFVSRLKENADYIVVKNRSVPRNRNILENQLIQLVGFKAQKDCPHILRRVVVWDEEKSQGNRSVNESSGIRGHHDRRYLQGPVAIELFFKALKQNLKVKTFVGTSENALLIQIWTALIAILLIKFLQFKSKMTWSLSNLIALLRLNLFTYRNLWEWIDV